MDAKTIAALMLKVSGLVIIGACVTQLPSYFPVRLDVASWSPVEAMVSAAMTVGPAALLGICLWTFPGTISNKIVVSGPRAPESIAGNTILLVAVAVLGLFLIAHGVTDFVFQVATIIQVQRLNPGNSFVPASVFAGAVASVVEAIFGLVFLVGRRGISALIERMRG